MGRYLKRAIAILAVALMCSSFIGGGVLAENENESGINDELTLEGSDNNHEDIPEVSPDGEPGAVSGDTKSNQLTVNVEGQGIALASAVSAQSADTCPVELRWYSVQNSPMEDSPVRVKFGNTIEYYAKITNPEVNDDDLSDVVVKMEIDPNLTPDINSAKYCVTDSISSANKKPIAGSSDYSVSLDGNNVIFTAKTLERGNFVRFHITCSPKGQEGKVSSKASIVSVGGTPYTGVESTPQWHEIYQEVSGLTLGTNAILEYTSYGRGSGGYFPSEGVFPHEYYDTDRIFTYTLSFMQGSKGVEVPLTYQLKSGDEVVKEDLIELKNGIGHISFPAKYKLVIPKIPTGVTYNITLEHDSNFTWDKESASGTIKPYETSDVKFTGTNKYVPVAYSLDTSIEVNIQGREFKKGDAFHYSIYCENGPTFNKIPYKTYGNDDEFADYENEVRIKPSSGHSDTMQLKEKKETVATDKMGCGIPIRGGNNFILFHDSLGCFSGHAGPFYVEMNTRPEIWFMYPGTYDYIIFQNTMEADDYDNIQQDSTQYKVSVRVTASGANLSASLAQVYKSIDGGNKWTVVANKSRLVFTNILKIDGVVKGDINKDGYITMNDVIACWNHVSKKKILTGEALIAADVDGGGVSMNDVIKLLNFVSKKP